jgi:hypothetical protein
MLISCSSGKLNSLTKSDKMAADPNIHTIKLSTHYQRNLNKIKELLRERRFHGKKVSACKAIEFLLDLYNTLPFGMIDVMFPSSQQVFQNMVSTVKDVANGETESGLEVHQSS